MNPGSVLSIAAASFNLLTAVLQLAVSNAPGWKQARLFSVIAFTASLYSACSVVFCLSGVDDETILVVARLTYLVAHLHVTAWILYAYTGADGDMRAVPKPVRALLGTSVAIAGLIAVAGWHLKPVVSVVEVPWAGISYRYPLPTPFGDWYGLLIPALLAIAFWRLTVRYRQGEISLRNQLGSFGVFFLLTFEEALVANRYIRFPSLADVGFVIVVVPLTLQMIRRVIDDSRQLLELSGRLRDEVVQRTEERDTAQTALAEAEQHIRTLVSSLDVIVWESDVETLKSLYVSDGVERLMGYSPADWYNTTEFWTRHLHPEDRDRALADERLAIESGRPVTTEYRMLAADGRIVWFRDLMQPLLGPGGTPVRLRGIMLDVTESRRAQQALLESEERYRALFESANDGVALLEDRRFVAVNRKIVELFRRDEREILGSTPAELSPGRQDDGVSSRLRAEELLGLAESGIPQRFLWTHSRADDSTFTAEICLGRVPVRGRNYLLVIMRDVTAQLQLEEELRQAQKMESIGRLAGGVAHEFNNLLTVINGYGDLLLGDTPADDRRRRQIEHIREAGERAASLTQQLLAFSRQQLFQPQRLNLNDVIARTVKMLERVAGGDIELVVEYDPSLGMAAVDPAQIQQVLMNLTANARDAMPHGGRLLVKTAMIRADGQHERVPPQLQAGLYVMLTVADSGSGMTEEVRKRVFEPFFTTKDIGKGAGLGLPSVYGIVHQHGGEIEVQSEPSEGTTFRIYLPCVENAAAKDVEPHAGPPEGGGAATLLVVEDEDTVRKLVAGVLRSSGYEVLESSNGFEALKIAEKHGGKIHLLISDLIMPGMSGRELWERMRPLRPEARTLFISGYSAEVTSGGQLSGSVAYLAKPFAPTDLLAKVHEILHRAT